MRQDINCRSENIIYLVWHAGSRFMYKFLQMHLKLYHQYRNKSPGCKTEMHFFKPEHSVKDFSITGIVQLVNPPRDPIGRLSKFEGYWMIKLQTLEPYGMNGINEYQRIIAKNGLHGMFEV